ncbi:DUF6025 family protein [Actinocorallia sp. A-T 12471]|uniref:DUF6025 family protein n=1 Tax=Actinocorallia sp. A-T 12471 TaxID=3089813 RepID=UPI0029D31D02|nr:DUF6025 family protein [Actinocorallia sp. A-T 12471]MDX6742365.1 DUF6025 family protein [Actinocorallia sp. A-T 12471]
MTAPSRNAEAGGLGLLARLGFGDAGSREEWEELAGRGRGLAWRHLGRSAAAVGDAVAALRATPGSPPRTGHAGDWGDVWGGRSRVLDYNAVVCRDLGAGRPLLYDFTQTETAALDGGDTLFLPGSLLRGGVRETLPLLRLVGGRFVPHDRTEPLFLPFVKTRREGGEVPLLRLHRERARPPVPVEYHSELWARHRARITEILTVLVESAPDGRALEQVFGRAVRRDGGVERAPLVRDGRGFRMGDTWYGSARDVADAALLAVAAATAGDAYDAVMRALPESVPLAGVDVVALTYAVLGAHRPDRAPAADGRPEVHVQWGALAMAGHPPGSKGYFFRRAQKAAWMYDVLVRALPWVSPIMFVIAPIAPFLLWAPERDTTDLDALEALLNRVGALAAAHPSPGRLAPEVRKAVAAWTADHPPSPDLRDRLAWRSRVARAPLPESGLCEPRGLAALSFAQSCLTVDSLITAAAGAAGKEDR